MDQKETSVYQNLFTTKHNNLFDLIPPNDSSRILDYLKANMDAFIDYLAQTDSILHHAIDIGLKTNQYQDQYCKQIGFLCTNLFAGDSYSVHFLFFPNTQSSIDSNMDFIQDQKGVNLTRQAFTKQFKAMLHLCEYLHCGLEKINPICMNYFTKLLTNLIQSKGSQFFGFLYAEQLFIHQLYADKTCTLDKMIQYAYNFGNISEVLGKLVGEEGQTHKFRFLKQKIVEGMLKNLLHQNSIYGSTQNYQFLLDFIVFIFNRNRYCFSGDDSEQFCEITQRFLDEDTLWSFKEQLIKANNDANRYCKELYSLKSRNKNNKLSIEDKNKIQNNILLIESNENAFQNTLNFLVLVVERMNFDEQPDSHNHGHSPVKFNVEEALFCEDSLYELLTLQIPSKFTNLSKVKYYEFIFLLTKNSRFQVSNPIWQNKPIFLNILIHYLKSFNEQFKSQKNKNKSSLFKQSRPYNNSMIKFLIQQIISQSILPKIKMLDEKQGMLVLSAFNPCSPIFDTHLCIEDRPFLFKIIVILQQKCEWFSKHFVSDKINVSAIKSQFKKTLCPQTSTVNERNTNIQEFNFIQPSSNNSNNYKQQQEEWEILKKQEFEDNRLSEYLSGIPGGVQIIHDQFMQEEEKNNHNDRKEEENMNCNMVTIIKQQNLLDSNSDDNERDYSNLLLESGQLKSNQNQAAINS